MKQEQIRILMLNQCSFVYPYPSVSDFAGQNSDHGRGKLRPKLRPPQTLYLTGKGETETVVYLSGEGKLRVWSEFGVFLGVWVEERALS